MQQLPTAQTYRLRAPKFRQRVVHTATKFRGRQSIPRPSIGHIAQRVVYRSLFLCSRFQKLQQLRLCQEFAWRYRQAK